MMNGNALLQAQMRQAEQHLKAGRFEAAEAACRSILASAPQALPAMQMLGVALAQRGDRAGAERAFRQYIAINPKSAPVTSNLGNLCMLKGDSEGAAQWYRAAIALAPAYPETHFNLGLALKAQDRLADSLAALNAAMRLKKNYVEAMVQAVSVLIAMEDFEAAVAMADRAIALRDDFFEAHYNHAIALLGLNKLEDARLAFARAGILGPDNHLVFLKLGETLFKLQQRALATSALARAAVLKPDCAEAHGLLAQVFLADGWIKAAIDEIGKALALEPDNASHHVVHAQILSDLNRLEEASAEYGRAVELEPESLDALSALGRSHLTVGRTDEAKAVFERALALDPGNIGAQLDMARIGKFAPGDERLAALESFLPKESGLPVADRLALHFALGKAYDECGDIDRAFGHFNAANALQGQSRTVDEDADVEWLERTKKVYTKEFMAEHLGGGSRSNIPIFVLGMPRSGTTLIEQIISSHPSVKGAGEVQDFYTAIQILFNKHKFTTPLPELARKLSNDALVELADTYVERLQQRAPGATRITDKLLSNYNRLGLIRLALPNAAIIHCMRNPVDCCVSIYTNLFAEVHADNNDLAALGRSYGRYHRLMEHWRQVLPDGSFLDVEYEDTVRDIETTAKRIIAYCGLEWDARCLDFQQNRRAVTTLSITQVRQPVYTSSVERWRRYEKHLAPLLEALGDLAPK